MDISSYQVKVTNNSDATITDRFDGVPYTFASGGRSVNIPYEAATHIFGVQFAPDSNGYLESDMREKIFKHLEKRWGWNRTTEADKGRKIFEDMSFKLISMSLVEKEVTENPLPLPEPREGTKSFVTRFLSKKPEGEVA